MYPAVANLVAEDGSWVARSAVTDPSVYAHEQRSVFQREWLVVAHTSQLRPGQFISSWAGDEPVIVSCDKTGSYHVVLNSCSHRGSRICRVDQGSATSFTCPNHGWTFGADGRLLGVPHRTIGYGGDADTASLSLATARVAVRHGLVFATFGECDKSIDDHLGDASYYLETVFDRYTAGLEVIDGTLRSLIQCNWKLAMENLGTDLQHPEFAHGAFMDIWPDPVMEFMEEVEQVLTRSGHPACIGGNPPPYTEAELVLSSIEGAAERREVREWFERTNREAADLLGKERAEFYVFTGSVFPNLSFLPGVSAVFLIHPRGPEETEWWSWCVVAADAPPAVRAMRRQIFTLTCGPGGLILAEDAENWADMTRMARGTIGERRPFRVDRGMGEEYELSEHPGTFAPMRSEHVQRGFWMNWRRAMTAEV